MANGYSNYMYVDPTQLSNLYNQLYKGKLAEIENEFWVWSINQSLSRGLSYNEAKRIADRSLRETGNRRIHMAKAAMAALSKLFPKASEVFDKQTLSRYAYMMIDDPKNAQRFLSYIYDVMRDPSKAPPRRKSLYEKLSSLGKLVREEMQRKLGKRSRTAQVDTPTSDRATTGGLPSLEAARVVALRGQEEALSRDIQSAMGRLSQAMSARGIGDSTVAAGGYKDLLLEQMRQRAALRRQALLDIWNLRDLAAQRIQQATLGAAELASLPFRYLGTWGTQLMLGAGGPIMGYGQEMLRGLEEMARGGMMDQQQQQQSATELRPLSIPEQIAIVGKYDFPIGGVPKLEVPLPSESLRAQYMRELPEINPWDPDAFRKSFEARYRGKFPPLISEMHLEYPALRPIVGMPEGPIAGYNLPQISAPPLQLKPMMIGPQRVSLSGSFRPSPGEDIFPAPNLVLPY